MAIFIGGCIAEGIYLGLRDRFGPNVIEGYRAYKRECAFWEALRQPDGSYGLPTLNSQSSGDRTPGPVP